ncbi:MAG: M13 family metallopeptidase [Xanthomonadales bacterium]|nr:M13 family metallopeptidase [Xanthomonadales bacterium]
MKKTPLFYGAVLALLAGACSQETSEQSTAQQPAAEPAAETAKAAPVSTEVVPDTAPPIDFEGFDESVRPQDNFFEFVNGKWLADTDIPGDQARWGSFLILRERSREAVRDIIEDLAATENLEPGSAAQKIRDFYRSYTDIERRNALGIDPLKSELERIESIGSKAELASYFGRASRISVEKPFALFINQDAKNPEAYIAQFWQTGLGLPDRDYYFDEGERPEKLRTEYVAYVTRLFELAGMDDAAGLADTVMDIETQLAEHHWTRVANRDREKRYNKVARAELAELAPAVAWDQYLAATGVHEEDAFIVNQPSYFEGMSQVIEGVSLDGWKTYMKARLLSDAAPFLSDDFYQANFEFYSKTLQGREQPPELWKRGVDTVNGTVGELVGQIYVQRHFPPAAKERMVDLVENLKKAMAQSIDNLEWMTEETKTEAHDKLQNFTTKIGYPDEWRDYSALVISDDDLLGNLERVSQFEHEYQIGKLGGPIDRNEWFMNPQTVNAYYNPSMNEIVFPAAILQPPFFNMNADDAVNYGAIGAVIGHEIGHGFDDQGRKSDGTGTLRDWWTEEDAAEYQKRADALVAQYNQYEPVEGANINGELTLGENIGDLGGLTIAWRAYQLSKDGDEPAEIDGYTPDQRFFLSFAQIWRNKSREDYLRQQVKTDPHSPPRYRVLGSLPNFDPFYEVFDVKEGDGMWMPPDQRVSIW